MVTVLILKCHGRQLAPNRCNDLGGGSVWDVVVQLSSYVRWVSGVVTGLGGWMHGGVYIVGAERLLLAARAALHDNVPRPTLRQGSTRWVPTEDHGT